MVKALYRQYRPRTFDQILGQDRVVNVLKNQVEKGMISHAYLFSGERGCGKTSCAKIFAKAINCKNPKNGSPCLECENCLSIDEETTIDVVEMDAASNRRIDDIRQIKETVIYPPNNLRYKVYIIDEAHMITKEAFNALLKIMEEPPSHLVFILATTEIDKIPSTILSRVQKFEFNKIDREAILKQIDIILNDLNIKMDIEAKDLIIRNAKGAMRDALSILDQVISSSKDSYDLSDVENILGVVGFKDLFSLASNINSFDKKSSLVKLFDLRNSNKSNQDILLGLTTFYHDLLVYKSTLDRANFDSDDKFSYIEKFAEEIDNSRLMDSLEILSDYSQKMRYSENTDLILELAILRLIDYKNINSLESRIKNLEKSNKESIVDLVNSIVESKIKNISNFFKIENSDFLQKNHNENSIDFKNNFEQKEPNNAYRNNFVKDQSTENCIKNTKIYTEKEDEIKQNYKTFDKIIEEKIIGKIIKEVGPIIATMFNLEGFNYYINEECFYLIYKDSMYYTFLQDKKEELKKIIESFLDRDIEFKIISDSEKLEFQKAVKEEESETSQVIKELEKIFGNELIIE